MLNINNVECMNECFTLKYRFVSFYIRRKVKETKRKNMKITINPYMNPSSISL